MPSYYRTIEEPTFYLHSTLHLHSHDDSVWVPFIIPIWSDVETELERTDKSTVIGWPWGSPFLPRSFDLATWGPCRIACF